MKNIHLQLRNLIGHDTRLNIPLESSLNGQYFGTKLTKKLNILDFW